MKIVKFNAMKCAAMLIVVACMSFLSAPAGADGDRPQYGVDRQRRLRRRGGMGLVQAPPGATIMSRFPLAPIPEAGTTLFIVVAALSA